MALASPTAGPAATTTINLNGGQTVINWTPTDNAVGTGTNITFQNSGTTATFTSGSSFAVLNRVLPTDISRAIVMNGTVNSRVAGAQGGSVYFYSPSGFILGGTSAFSVGSLVVTASPLTLDGSGNFIANFGTGNNVVFGQALNPNASIVSGGTVSANIPSFGVGGSAGDSYVAMIAPHVVHTGNINVNGSAALVAAEAATISFSTDGLFDIQVTAGSTSSSGLDVTGDITGPAPVDADDQQRVFLVAVPKNQLMTMVIGNGADLGFTLAGSAAIDDNGAVVLSAGHDIVDGQIGAKSAAPGTGTAGITITGAHATNNVFAEATGNASISSSGRAADDVVQQRFDRACRRRYRLHFDRCRHVIDRHRRSRPFHRYHGHRWPDHHRPGHFDFVQQRRPGRGWRNDQFECQRYRRGRGQRHSRQRHRRLHQRQCQWRDDEPACAQHQCPGDWRRRHGGGRQWWQRHRRDHLAAQRHQRIDDNHWQCRLNTNATGGERLRRRRRG